MIATTMKCEIPFLACEISELVQTNTTQTTNYLGHNTDLMWLSGQ